MVTGAAGTDGKLVVLVKVNRPSDMHVPPLGIMYLGDALKKKGYRTKIFHISEHYGQRDEQIIRNVRKYFQIILNEKPLFVGFSVLTGVGIRSAVALSRMIKKSSSIPVVWGNVHPSLLPEQCLGEDYIDIVCIGEGEETAIELAQALEKGRDLSGIEGIGYKDNENKLIINKRRPFIKDLDRYDTDWDLIKIEDYLTPDMGYKRTLRIIASRGCPYNCTFCYNQVFNQRKRRAHSADHVINKFTKLAKKYDIEAFYFNDDNFFVDKDWGWKILQGLNLPYFIKLRAEYITEDFAERLASTNCKEVVFGFESGSDKVLKEIVKKGSGVQDHIRATKILSRYPQIKITAAFIVGMPGETRDNFKKTVKMMCYLLKIHPNISFTPGYFIPFPGTEMSNAAIKRGFSPPSTTVAWNMVDKFSDELEITWVDWMTSKKAVELRKAVDVLCALYDINAPVFKQTVHIMVLKGSYSNLLIKMLNKMLTHYSSGNKDRYYTRLIRVLGDSIRKKKLRRLNRLY